MSEITLNKEHLGFSVTCDCGRQFALCLGNREHACECGICWKMEGDSYVVRFGKMFASSAGAASA